ncbi:dTDP-4-dehydrorhamnose reductase [Aquimarina sp. AU474]|uniref:dTDP-4-dehydrorhamnose reductase n=1 Tax=Aquimarina sp. AU474 TaxID=2108529 RepID=UPI000D690A24|nr:dTDP-4-dehydrorhamnose reductase [Aquimarina sp. AU474]
MDREFPKKRVLVTGSNGQLGQCIHKIRDDYPELNMYFANSAALDITNSDQIQGLFVNNMFDFVINCAAYTNVDKAEKNPEIAFLVNSQGAKNLAEVCKEHNATLIHISTDYVFDGKKESPYTEKDTPNPINEYGKSKLAGEKHIQESLEKYFIIRTSWLYSEFGHNFFKTIKKKSEIEEKLTIVSSEIGTPTNANDLARFILDLILINSCDYGIYHYSNEGEATWYDFAKEILRLSGKQEVIKLEKTDNYPTFAQRPKYSVLDKSKTKQSFLASVIEWSNSLRNLNK